jgi:hypothetical protein
MNIEEGFVGQAIEQCGRHLGYFHIGESHRGYLGTGTVDFTAVFRSLARIGYDGPIAFESFSSAVVDPQLSNMLGVWRNIWSDSHDLARHAKAFMEAQRLAAAHAVAAGAEHGRRLPWASPSSSPAPPLRRPPPRPSAPRRGRRRRPRAGPLARPRARRPQVVPQFGFIPVASGATGALGGPARIGDRSRQPVAARRSQAAGLCSGRDSN